MKLESKHSIGDKVKIRELDQAGRIDAIQWSVNGIEYRVVYWWDGVRHSDWMAEWEVE